MTGFLCRWIVESVSVEVLSVFYLFFFTKIRLRTYKFKAQLLSIDEEDINPNKAIFFVEKHR